MKCLKIGWKNQEACQYLMSLNPNKEASKLLRFLKDQKDEHKVFMIGSILRGYRPKSK